MTHAYQEIYLNKAQSVLGDAFDYAINTCGIAGKDFIKLFLASTACGRMENGEPTYIAGKSGIEIVLEIVSETMNKEITNCLLYTSPSPRDSQKSRMPSSA